MRPPASRHTPSWLLYATLWMPLLVCYVALFAAQGATTALAFRASIASLLPAALLGLAVRGLARLLPWPERSVVSFLVIQGGLALAYALTATLGWLVLLAADRFLTTGTPQFRPVPGVIAWQAMIYVLLYAGLAGASYAGANADRVYRETARSVRAESLRVRAELDALRSQVNPHFILNTLHTLIGLVRREPALAEQGLERLGELLRYGLRLHREGLDQVALREEWEFVKSYLEIERLRLGERLRLTLRADEAALDCPVPPFSLQPLVENAVRHGIAPRAPGGSLEITAACRDGRLRLEVCDDGPGIPASGATATTGLGLRLLRERLAALYGADARLVLETAGAGGLRATLDLPADPGAELPAGTA